MTLSLVQVPKLNDAWKKRMNPSSLSSILSLSLSLFLSISENRGKEEEGWGLVACEHTTTDFPLRGHELGRRERERERQESPPPDRRGRKKGRRRRPPRPSPSSSSSSTRRFFFSVHAREGESAKLEVVAGASSFSSSSLSLF